ncbi:universal stress protein [Ammoniphilus sp. CFH 90114]|uniref:universal stress protein n=1 Tax=Ammoniphilus sp. CFH 90114 TaxID=2493665 RepID=UPI0013E8FD6E|nr:universal stress protein [Ammoniphilus sp. CFH 90114]
MYKILLATDGSEHANRAVEQTLFLAGSIPQSEVTLIHVSSKIPPREKLFESNFNVLSILEDQAHDALKQTEKQFQEQGIDYRLEVAWGDPASEIVNQAKREGSQVIIIGSRGLGRLSEVIMGSVSQRVLHEAHCPVMIVK